MGHIKIFVLPSQEWTDDNLRWNESEYGDIKDLRIPPAYIWAPDILMYNRSVTRERELPEEQVRLTYISAPVKLLTRHIPQMLW